MKKLSYDEIRLKATCASRVQQLARILARHAPCDPAGPFGDLKTTRSLGETVRGIEVVLDMLAHVGNAHINREALEAMACYVREAQELLANDWAKELLDRVEELLPEECTDEVPF